LWEAKKRQHIPVVFCGGTPEKVLITKENYQKRSIAVMKIIGNT
jgi:hypothetical protein